jgi:hypothetical protein
MVGYVALPAFRAPAPLDFSGLNEGLDVLGKSIERNRLLEEQKEIGAALRSGGQGATSSSAPQYGATAQPNRLLSSTSTPAQYSARGVTDRIVGAESGGNPNATNPRSSATGSGQFINSTWLDQIKRNRPDLAAGKTDDQILAMRTDDKLSREITGQYANENSQALRSAGFDPTPGNQYLSHFAGPGGARAVLSADPSAPVRSVLGERVVQANPFLANMTAGDLITWANGKMGGPSAPASVPQPTGPNFASAADVAFGQGRVDTGLSLLEAGRERENQSYARSRQERQDERQARMDAQTTEVNDITLQQKRQELETTAQRKLAGIAQTIGAQTDPATRAAMWQKFVAVNPRIAATLEQYDVDPRDAEAGSAFLIAEARGLTDPKPSEYGTFKQDEGIFRKGPAGVQVLREPGVKPETTQENAKLEQSLRKEWTSLTTDLRSINDSLGRMRASSQDNSGPGDIAMVYSYMKMLDPTSVVREGEYATAEQTAGLPQQVVGLYNKMLTGERLTPQQRQQFLASAEIIAKDKSARFDAVRGQYTNIARAAGLDPARVMLDEGQPGGSATPDVQLAPRPQGATDQQIIEEAQRAIQSGKDEKAVRQQLEAWGIRF